MLKGYVVAVVLAIAGTVCIAWALQLPRYSEPDWDNDFIGVEIRAGETSDLSRRW